uniref:Uncharacterized protein n=1 Tax=Rhizophora mucronata TaxID=61149 RepID=A0A2P2PEX6_RHIMU
MQVCWLDRWNLLHFGFCCLSCPIFYGGENGITLCLLDYVHRSTLL